MQKKVFSPFLPTFVAMKPLTDTDYIHTLIAEGEHQQQDFKFEISDARKIAKTLSAFANTDGGRLLIGVKDNGKIAGVRSEEEKYIILEIHPTSLFQARNASDSSFRRIQFTLKWNQWLTALPDTFIQQRKLTFLPFIHTGLQR